MISHNISKELPGFKGRGSLVLNSLKKNTVEDIVSLWSNIIPNSYKPFNIIAGNAEALYHMSCNQSKTVIQKLKAGFHISTGLGFNQKVPRDIYLRKQLSKEFRCFSQPVSPDCILNLMSSHNCGIGSEDSICVHDKGHLWETRSTSLMVNDSKYWKVKSKDGPACHDGVWECKDFELECT